LHAHFFFPRFTGHGFDPAILHLGVIDPGDETDFHPLFQEELFDDRLDLLPFAHVCRPPENLAPIRRFGSSYAPH
jgi:hypothetical protein